MSAQVVDVDLRGQDRGERGGLLGREAAARYADHGTALLAGVPPHGSTARTARDDAADAWMLIGRWLTCVAVLSVLVVAFAS